MLGREKMEGRSSQTASGIADDAALDRLLEVLLERVLAPNPVPIVLAGTSHANIFN